MFIFNKYFTMFPISGLYFITCVQIIILKINIHIIELEITNHSPLYFSIKNKSAPKYKNLPQDFRVSVFLSSRSHRSSPPPPHASHIPLQNTHTHSFICILPNHPDSST